MDDLDLPLSDVWRSGDQGQSWQEVIATPGLPQWAARHAHSLLAERAGAIESALYIIAGSGLGGVPLSDVWRSVDGGSSWYPQNMTAAFPPRAHHAAVVSPDDSAMAVLGGLDSSQTPMNDVWVSLDSGVTWSQRAGLPSAVYGMGAIVDTYGAILVIGGTPYSPSVSAAACLA
eukprot:TRINITY_DN28560_c0_g1_i3.p1 TRINITY_DN28560_c0_g1~~TRINITY_DN28560_c0_g1_i3.p1  ORF type:complete len:174 (-),score=18.52 TRINITY_DN28560_c0_g1_i3:207-728(-)